MEPTAEPLVTFAVVRRALLRAALASAGLAVLLAVFLVVYAGASARSLKANEPLVWGASGLFLGVVVAPLALLEEVARRRPPSFRRDALLAVATLAVAWVGFGLAFLQLAYTGAAARGSTPAEAWHASREVLDGVRRKPSLLLLMTAFVMPVVPLAVARCRSIRLGRQLLLVPLATAPLLVPFLIVLAPLHYHVGAIAAIVVCAAFVLPLVQAGGDALAGALGRPSDE